MDKKQIRKQYKTKRDEVSGLAAKECSMRLSFHILRWKLYQKAGRIYFYYPLGNEISLIQVITDALANGKRLAFPKVNGDQMRFYEINSLGQLSEGCFHVMEPRIEQGEFPKPADWEDALCFVPGVAFDKTGARLGYGKGYYDRYFAKKSGCRLAGCAYQCQVADALMADSWDIRMDYLITENGIVQTSK